METNDRCGGLDRRVMQNVNFNARRLSRARAVPGMAIEDYRQDLISDLLHRSKTFDSRRASFRTFANHIVAHRTSTLAAPTLRLRSERKTESLDSTLLDGDGNAQALLDVLPDDAAPTDENAAIRIDVGRFIVGLPQQLIDCCEALLADNVSAGARAAGMHRSTVYERAARLRERAIRHGLTAYLTDAPDTFGPSPVDGQRSLGLTDSGFDQQRVTMEKARAATARLSLTESELVDWLETAGSGETLEYYRGFLLLDTVQHVSRVPEAQRLELVRVAECARRAAENRKAYLLQRRHGSDDYSYLIVARRHASTEPRPEHPVAEVVS
jgi:hypothetical protein